MTRHQQEMDEKNPALLSKDFVTTRISILAVKAQLLTHFFK